jgi:hypothetical protein
MSAGQKRELCVSVMTGNYPCADVVCSPLQLHRCRFWEWRSLRSLPPTHVNVTNVIAPAMRDAQLNTRASGRTLAESASPISISARLSVGLAVLARLAIKSVRAGRRPAALLKMSSPIAARSAAMLNGLAITSRDTRDMTTQRGVKSFTLATMPFPVTRRYER